MGDGIDDLAEAESTFGPGFDLIVGLLAVVLVALQLSRASLASALGGVTDLNYVFESKSAFLKTLCTDIATGGCSSTPKGAETSIAATLPTGRDVELRVTDIGTNQTLRIGDEVLFDPGRANLKPEGRSALQGVSRALRGCAHLLREVQVQGHADHLGQSGVNGNLRLASDRAIVVYEELVNDGIDPRALLLSAATYDSFKPVDRVPGDPYDWEALSRKRSNQVGMNRRVEFQLIYRLAPLAGAPLGCR